jgi:hypothetical protein
MKDEAQSAQLRKKDEALSAAQEQLRVKDEALSAAQEQLRVKDEAISAAQSSVPVQAMQKQQGKAPVSTALLLAIQSREWARARKLIASGADVNFSSPRVGLMLVCGPG